MNKKTSKYNKTNTKSQTKHLKSGTSSTLHAKRAELRRNRPIHKRFLLHPGTVFFLLLTGVMIVGWTYTGFADSYDVRGRVPAPIPGSPAEITSPVNQTHFTTTPQTVTGVCPTNSYVKLYRNGNFSGVTTCGSTDTTYSVATDLSPGSNELYTRVFNITDDEGPESSHITVWYDPPAPVTNITKGTTVGSQQSRPSIPSSTSEPFFIVSDYKQYRVYDSGQPASWELSLSGGTGPYDVTVLWGDGDQSTVTRSDKSAFTISHSYAVDGAEQATYKIKVLAVDATQATAFLQLLAIINSGSKPVSATLSTNSSPGSGIASHLPSTQLLAWIVWPTYSVVTLMTLSYWLGERQIAFNLAKHAAGPNIRRRT